MKARMKKKTHTLIINKTNVLLILHTVFTLLFYLIEKSKMYIHYNILFGKTIVCSIINLMRLMNEPAVSKFKTIRK